MGISSSIRRFYEYQTANDIPIVFEIVRKKYSVLPKILGLYFDLKTPSGRVWTVITYLINVTVVAFYTFIFLMTAIHSYSWSIGYSMQTLNYALMHVTMLTFFYLPITKRRKLAGIHLSMAIDMMSYDEEVVSPATTKVKVFIDKIMKYVSFCPFFWLLGTFSMTFRPQESERYVNGLDLSLPLAMWYPFYVDTTFRYALVFVSQLFLCHLYVSFSIFCLIFAIGCALYCLVQLMRLVDSVNGLQFRATEMMKKCYTSRLVKLPIEELLLDECYVQCYIECLKENFEHYKIIKRYLEDFQDGIGLPFMVLFLSLGLVIGSAMITITADDFLGPKINAIFIGFIQLTGSFIFCFIGQQITDSSERLRAAVYNMQWPGSHRNIQIFVKIFMLATARPLKPAAWGLIAFNLNSFAGMTEVAYKSYNVLILTR